MVLRQILNAISNPSLDAHTRLLWGYILLHKEVEGHVPNLKKISDSFSLLRRNEILEALGTLERKNFIHFKGSTYEIEELYKKKLSKLAQSIKKRLQSNDLDANPVLTLILGFQRAHRATLRKKMASDNVMYSTFRGLCRKFSAKFVADQIKPFFEHEAPKLAKVRSRDFRDYVTKHFKSAEHEFNESPGEF